MPRDEAGMKGSATFKTKKTWVEKVIGGVERRVLGVYSRQLWFFLRYRWISAVIWFVCVFGTGYLFYKVPKSFLPVGDSSFIRGVLVAQEGSSPEQMHKYQDAAEKIMHANPAVASTFTMSGNGQFMPANQAFLIAFLKQPSQRAPIDQVAGQLMGGIMSTVPGALAFLQPNPVLEISTRATANVQGEFAYALSGIDPNQVYDSANKLLAKMHEYSGFLFVNSDLFNHTPNLQVDILRDQAKLYGASWTLNSRTLDSRRDSLELTKTLEEHGINSLLDARQSEQLVYTAAAEVPDLERQIAQKENAISILLGNNPGDIPSGLKLTEQPHAPEVPVGLPSPLLERRPDIREAEQNLVAANAQIGVARAAYFPQISLTGTAGYESAALTSLFTGPAGVWTLAGSLTQSIFEGGRRLKSAVRLAEAQHEELLLTYQQSIQGAFRDVSNALVAYRKNREFRIQQEHLVESAQDAARLSQTRFKAGTTDYLEVLTNETNSFSAELALAQAEGNELNALVQLYQALGGGWE